jgi:NADH:ubiquinone oxidoreductase subunit F (NADH-binding)
MAIAGYAMGATVGYNYLRGRPPEAQALRQA